MRVEQDQIPQGAPLWRRFMAMVYDSLLLGALTMAYGGVTTFILYLVRGDTSGGKYQPMIDSSVGNTFFLVGLLLTLGGFYVFFWCRAGQTAGMRAWRLQVIRQGTLPALRFPDYGQAAIRALLAGPALLLLGAGYWWRYVDASGDCLHDKLSQTKVVVTPPRKK